VCIDVVMVLVSSGEVGRRCTENRLGFLCTIDHGNIHTTSSLLNMNSSGSVHGIVRTGIIENLAVSLELFLREKVRCTRVLAFLFISTEDKREDPFLCAFSNQYQGGNSGHPRVTFPVIPWQSEIRAGAGTTNARVQ